MLQCLSLSISISISPCDASIDYLYDNMVMDFEQAPYIYKIILDCGATAMSFLTNKNLPKRVYTILY